MKSAVILTSTTEHLAKDLKEKLKDGELIFLDKNKEGERFFPDGETYIRISKISNLKTKRVIVLHSGAPKPNESLVELELILQILKDHKIKPEVFFTYFPYSQQDKVFLKGETNATESLIKKLINYYEVKKIYAIDPHFGKMNWLKKYPITSISAVPLLMQKMKKDFGEDVLFMSPDKGGKRRTGISGLDKKRIDSFRVELASLKSPLRGKTIGVIDDILETGGTLSKFYDHATMSGAKRMVALIAHGPFEPGIRKIKNKFSKLYLTNTVNTKKATVDVAGLIIKAIYES